MTRVVTTPSYCRVCPALCGILVDVDTDTHRVIRVRGDDDNAMSRGFTCPKGRALPAEHNADDRLRSALRRRDDGSFEPMSSDAAIAEIAARLGAIIAEHGPRSVGLYVGTRGYEVLPLAAASAWLHGIGSPSLYSTYTIDQPGKDLARAIHGSWPAGFQDVDTSDVVMLVGTNPLVSAVTSYIAMPMSNLRVELRERKRKGLRLIVIDPRVTETAHWADVHLRPRPGEDAAVLAGMIRIIIDEGRFDAAFVEENTRGFERLRDAVAAFTPELVAQRADVAPDDLAAAARMFVDGPRGCAVGGTGINMAPHPILSEYLLLCLNTLCGRYRRAGETVSNPGVLTKGRKLVAGPRGPRAIWGHGDAQPRVRDLATLYDQMPAAALSDEILTPGEGQIRALIVSGGNPLVALPDQQKTMRAFEQLDLLVSLDVRLTQTAVHADYVIGCTLSLEKADSTLAHDLRFPQPFAQYTPPVVEAEGDVIDEWAFFWQLAREMNTPWDIAGRVGMPIPIDVEAPPDPTTKPTAEQLWRMLCGGARVPFDEVAAYPHGVTPELDPVVITAADAPVADEQRLELADTALMTELAGLATIEARDLEYPYLLTSRRMWEYYNSWGQNIDAMRRRVPGNPAFMHPDDLTALGIVDDDLIKIESRRGAVRAVARAAPDVARGTISMAHCWGGPDGDGDGNGDPRIHGSPTSRLVDNAVDVSAIVGMARQSAIPVRCTRIGDPTRSVHSERRSLPDLWRP